MLNNAFHVVGECRRQVNHLNKSGKKMSTFWNFMTVIMWNHHEKYIERSTNTPIIGSLIREIAAKMSKYEEKTTTRFC